MRKQEADPHERIIIKREVLNSLDQFYRTIAEVAERRGLIEVVD